MAELAVKGEPLHGGPSAASVEVGMVGAEDTEPVETVGDGDSDNALLEAADARETKSLLHMIMKSKNLLQ